MKPKTKLAIILISFCLLSSGLAADNRPEKRVMKFIAVMDFNCGTYLDKPQCEILTELVIGELTKSKQFTVIDRANRNRILKESGFQQSGCVDEKCTVEVGRILGVGKIVVGSIAKLGATYLVTLQLVNVETAAIEKYAKEICKDCKADDLVNTVTNAANKLLGQLHGDGVAQDSYIFIGRTKTAQVMVIFLDDEPAATMKAMAWAGECRLVKIKVSSGKHILKINYPLINSKKGIAPSTFDSILEIDVEAGVNYYYSLENADVKVAIFKKNELFFKNNPCLKKHLEEK